MGNPVPPGTRKREMRWESVLAVQGVFSTENLCTLETHLKAEYKLATFVEALEGEGERECMKTLLLWAHPYSVFGNPAMFYSYFIRTDNQLEVEEVVWV